MIVVAIAVLITTFSIEVTLRKTVKQNEEIIELLREQKHSPGEDRG